MSGESGRSALRVRGGGCGGGRTGGFSAVLQHLPSKLEPAAGRDR